MSDTCCGGACDSDAAPKTRATRGQQNAAVAASGLLISAGAATAWLGHPGWAIAPYLGSIALSMPTPATRAWRSLRARSLDINVLMLIAVAGAAALGDWFEAASVVWLFGIAQWLEARSLERARHAIRDLINL